MTADEKRPKGGQPGNRNTLKADIPATAHLHVRVAPDEKEAFQAAADAEKLKLSEWVLKHLRAVIGK